MVDVQFWILVHTGNPRRYMLRRLQETIEFLLLTLMVHMVGRLSLRNASAMGRILGTLVFTLTGFRKKVTLENLTRAFPEKKHFELHAIAHAAYRNYGVSIASLFWYGRQPADRVRKAVRFVNPDVYRDALNGGKGVIVLSGHYGSWELLPPTIRLAFGQPMLVIVQHQRNKRVDRMIDSIRCRFGNTTVSMGSSVREVIHALREGKAIAMLGDQSGPKEAEFAPFFGTPAATHRGAAAFSLKTGAPIVMVFYVRQEDFTHEAVFEEVDQSGLHGYSDSSVAELTRRHTAMLEKYIRLHPDHWLWMHRRWKHAEYYYARHGDPDQKSSPHQHDKGVSVPERL
jgi:Kdo2-lipid IVA lauroyltransferase/acyltransferase